MTNSARNQWLLSGVIAFIIPFQLQYNYLLNTFYHYGAVYFDAGWFANVIWRNDWMLTNPHPMGTMSCFAIHLFLILVPLSQLSWFLPVHMVEFYSGCMATIYALFAVAMLAALVLCVKPRNLWQTLMLAALAIGFSFNGIIMQGIWMSHIEYAIPLCIFLFILSYACGRYWPAAFFFVLTLSIREDAGFHLTAVAGLLGLIKAVEKRSIKSVIPEICIITCACIYSIFACWLTYHFHVAYYGANDSIFANIYSGHPFYAHLTWRLLSERAHAIFIDRVYLWLGFLVTMVWAIYKRNAYLAVGFAAYIPWFMLNWTAINDNTGWLYAYYPYPFALSLGWPVLAALYQYHLPLPPVVARETLVLQTVLVIIGLTVWNAQTEQLDFGPVHWAQWGSYRIQQGTEHRERILEFTTRLVSDDKALGTVAVDNGVLSLTAGPVAGSDLLFLEDANAPNVDSIIYFLHHSLPDDKVMTQAQKYQLSHHYCLEGTTICMFSNRKTDQLGTFSSLLNETTFPTQTYQDGM